MSEPRPTLWQIFTGFLELTLSGFGGVLAWAHRSLVERRAWLSEHDFASLLGLAQVLPGGNIINLTVFVGDRFRGLPGVLAAVAGLMIAPFILLLVVGVVLANPVIEQYASPALNGAAPVVAGMVLATGLKMARPHARAPRVWLLGGLTLVAVAVMQAPLLIVLAILGPLSIAWAWRSPS